MLAGKELIIGSQSNLLHGNITGCLAEYTALSGYLVKNLFIEKR